MAINKNQVGSSEEEEAGKIAINDLGVLADQDEPGFVSDCNQVVRTRQDR